jgi:hypothetical protein
MRRCCRWIALTSAAQGDSLHKTEEAYQAFCSVLASMEVQVGGWVDVAGFACDELASTDTEQAKSLSVPLAR